MSLNNNALYNILNRYLEKYQIWKQTEQQYLKFDIKFHILE